MHCYNSFRSISDVFLIGVVPSWTAILLLLVFIGVSPFKKDSCGGLGEQQCYCENTTSNVINEQSNTWSCVLFIVLGIALSCINAISRRQTTFDDVAFPTLLCALGPGSMFLHAFTTNWSQHVDAISMYILVTYLFAYSLARTMDNPQSQRAMWGRVLVSFVCMLVLLLVEFLTDDVVHEVMFIVLSSLLFIVESWNCWRLCKNFPYPVSLFFVGTLILIIGIVLKFVGNKEHLCNPKDFWQFHAGWHACSAFALFFYGIYYSFTTHKEDGLRGNKLVYSFLPTE